MKAADAPDDKHSREKGRGQINCELGGSLAGKQPVASLPRCAGTAYEISALRRRRCAFYRRRAAYRRRCVFHLRG
jgi:hypothetical protein